MRIALEWERESNEINTGNLWRSPCPNKRVQLPGLLTRDNKLSRTADTTNAREGENEMNKECNCDNLDQDVSGYTCYKCYERGN